MVIMRVQHLQTAINNNVRAIVYLFVLDPAKKNIRGTTYEMKIYSLLLIILLDFLNKGNFMFKVLVAKCYDVYVRCVSLLIFLGK